MKLFEINWDITCGEFGFLQTEIMVFENYKDANKYGKFREAEDNAVTQDDYNQLKNRKVITDKFLEQMREKAAMAGRYYKLCGVRELDTIIGWKNNKVYKIKLVKA